MPKFKIRPGFTFIKNGKGYPNIKVVDGDDPAFASQRFKFEAKPVDEELAKEADKAAKDAEITALTKPGAGRDAMIAKFTELNGGKPPRKSATKSELREVFLAMTEGEPFESAAAELVDEKSKV